MKRALGLIFVVAACIVGFLSIRGTMPFIPIYGSSMEPTLQSGGLLMIEPIEPQDVEVGDIIVFNVPSLVREYYSYPPVVAHRVIEIKTTPSLGFRTAGDNTGEEPFTIRPNDLRGTVGDQIPYLGLPLLFFQSLQGTIFVIIALVLLVIFLYGNELSRGRSFLHRGIFAPVIAEEKRASRVLTRKIEATEQKMSSTEQALDKFASAVAEYAQHLASHTSAIQGLSEASHELKRGAAEQNRVLMNLVERTQQPVATVAEPPPRVAPTPAPEKTAPLLARLTPELERLRLEREKAAQYLQRLVLEGGKPPRTEKAPPQAVKPPETARPSPEAVKSWEVAKPSPEAVKPSPEAGKPSPEAAKPQPEAAKPSPEVAKPSPEAGKAMFALLEAEKKQFPPGCARNRHPLATW